MFRENIESIEDENVYISTSGYFCRFLACGSGRRYFRTIFSKKIISDDESSPTIKTLGN